jgi:hypothetical protein
LASRSRAISPIAPYPHCDSSVDGPYKAEGDRVAIGDVIGLVEVMKTLSAVGWMALAATCVVVTLGAGGVGVGLVAGGGAARRGVA